MQCVSAGFCSAHPFGYFHTLHSESHTVWIHLGKHPLATTLINTIAYSFVARNGPKSFTKLKNALTAVADATVGNALQCVLFISNNKNMKPTL